MEAAVNDKDPLYLLWSIRFCETVSWKQHTLAHTWKQNAQRWVTFINKLCITPGWNCCCKITEKINLCKNYAANLANNYTLCLPLGLCTYLQRMSTQRHKFVQKYATVNLQQRDLTSVVCAPALLCKNMSKVSVMFTATLIQRSVKILSFDQIHLSKWNNTTAQLLTGNVQNVLRGGWPVILKSHEATLPLTSVHKEQWHIAYISVSPAT